MKELVLTQFTRLPEHLQLEVLHYIQFLLQKTSKSSQSPSKSKKPFKLTFTDFHFPESGQTYSRSDIYGDDGR
jgi:hypothetical protein